MMSALFVSSQAPAVLRHHFVASDLEILTTFWLRQCLLRSWFNDSMQLYCSVLHLGLHIIIDQTVKSVGLTSQGLNFNVHVSPSGQFLLITEENIVMQLFYYIFGPAESTQDHLAGINLTLHEPELTLLISIDGPLFIILLDQTNVFFFHKNLAKRCFKKIS